jgi:hypothetical protein
VTLTTIGHRSSARDFDCLLGRWTIVNRWLDDEGTWHEFPSTATVTGYVDGLVLIDEYEIPEFPTRGHVTAVNIRAFDETTAEWQLVWLASYCAPDMRPVVGAWTSEDEGEFFQSLECEGGRTVEVRFRYQRLLDGDVRWEQALSYDAGKTWAVDWTMQFVRA